LIPTFRCSWQTEAAARWDATTSETPSGARKRAATARRPGSNRPFSDRRVNFKDTALTIRYAGSKAKGTMNMESYDLDIVS